MSRAGALRVALALASLAAAGCPRPFVIVGPPPGRLAPGSATELPPLPASRLALSVDVQPQSIADAIEVHLRAGRLYRELSSKAALYGVARAPLRVAIDRDPSSLAPRLSLATQVDFVPRCETLKEPLRLGCRLFLRACGGAPRSVALAIHARLAIARDLGLVAATTIDPPAWQGSCLLPELAAPLDAWVGDRMGDLGRALDRLLAERAVDGPRALILRAWSVLAEPRVLPGGHVLTLSPRALRFVPARAGEDLELSPISADVARATLVVMASPRLTLGVVAPSPAAVAPSELLPENGPGADEGFHLSLDVALSFAELSRRMQAWLDDNALLIDGVRVRAAALRAGPEPRSVVFELTLSSPRWVGTAYVTATPSLAHDPASGWSLRLGSFRAVGTTDSALVAVLGAIVLRIADYVATKIEVVKAPSALALQQGFEGALHEALGAHAVLDVGFREPASDNVIAVTPDALHFRLRYEGRAKLTIR